MIHYALTFLLLALIGGAFGFFGLVGVAATVAKVIFFVVLALFLIGTIRSRR
jgi:uncharacterized membrane protein YtjA (UPF0391 family)